jgi:hypothetical protein
MFVSYRQMIASSSCRISGSVSGISVAPFLHAITRDPNLVGMSARRGLRRAE